ncbi:hypothetical protein ACLPJK_26750 [Pseudomonas aeruginosa]|uniref:hypothetical protein n=1 Tax=Pseudomonas aeruginosa TaxID=287 RepID=UPI003D28109C
MNHHSTIKILFEQAYESIENELIFDASWNNGARPYDGAVHVRLAACTRAKSFDPQTQRRIILVGTVIGTFVAFTKHAEEDRPFIVTSSVPVAGRPLCPPGIMSEDTFALCFLSDKTNIGTQIDDLIASRLVAD